jgi:glycosyltransferase involved in cell wall biosynthesis
LGRQDKVSIVIPVYNAAKYIEKCLNSVLKQTYDNIEVIIVNDGSEDNSKQICESYASSYKQIKVINQKNMGPSRARNRGIEESTGKYIQFVDSDDVVESEMTQKLVDAINSEVQLVICGYKKIYLESRVEKTVDNIPHPSGIKDIHVFLNDFGTYFEQILISSPWNKLYISDIIKENKLYFDPNVNLGEDLLFNLSYMKKCNKINIIQDTLYNYMNIENESLTRRYRKNLFFNQKMLFGNIKEFLIENNSCNSQNLDILENMYLGCLLVCFENIANHENKSSIRSKVSEINDILNDETVINAIRTVRSKRIQTLILAVLLKLKIPFGVFVIFFTKQLLRKKARYVFTFLKAINNIGK